MKKNTNFKKAIVLGILCLSAVSIAGCDDMTTDPGTSKPTFTPAPLVSKLPNGSKTENTSVNDVSSEGLDEFFYPILPVTSNTDDAG